MTKPTKGQLEKLYSDLLEAQRLKKAWEKRSEELRAILQAYHDSGYVPSDFLYGGGSFRYSPGKPSYTFTGELGERIAEVERDKRVAILTETDVIKSHGKPFWTINTETGKPGK